MERTVQDTKTLEEGRYKGTITDVRERKEPYAYIDVVCSPKDSTNTVKASYSDFLSEKSKLGQLIKRFGDVPKPGERVDVRERLMQKECSFVVIHREGKDGNVWPEVVPNSVKPLKAETQTTVETQT